MIENQNIKQYMENLFHIYIFVVVAAVVFGCVLTGSCVARIVLEF